MAEELQTVNNHRWFATRHVTILEGWDAATNDDVSICYSSTFTSRLLRKLRLSIF